MPLKLLLDLLTGNLALVNVPSSTPATEDFFLFIDGTEMFYSDNTNVDFIT